VRLRSRGAGSPFARIARSHLCRSGKRLGRFIASRALSDISFDLHEGDRLALIGHNGSGKARCCLIRQRDQIEAQADALLAGGTDYEALRQVPGIGPINALTILAEAGDLRRFGHHRQFLKFCGLDRSTHQSGVFRGQTRLSKFGNARLRRTLWMAATVAVRQKENSFRDKFERYIAKDRANADLKRKALTAVTAKMARVVHAVVKSGNQYRPFFEGSARSGRTPLSVRAVEARETHAIS
jgi:transposase